MNENDETLISLVNEAIESIDRRDSFEAAAMLLSAGPPRRIIEALNLAIRELFTQRKLVPMVWIGRTGIEFALREAHITTDIELRSLLLKTARVLSYNVSANLWPGWGDAAVRSTSSELSAALDLARFHLRLVEDERLGAESQGNAHWLVGAQRLALGQEQASHHSFEMAKSAYQTAGQRACEVMAEGYVALAMLHMATMATEGEQRFKVAISQLGSLGDDGEFFADQLRTARQAFLTTAE